MIFRGEKWHFKAIKWTDVFFFTWESKETALLSNMEVHLSKDVILLEDD